MKKGNAPTKVEGGKKEEKKGEDSKKPVAKEEKKSTTNVSKDVKVSSNNLTNTKGNEKVDPKAKGNKETSPSKNAISSPQKQSGKPVNKKEDPTVLKQREEINNKYEKYLNDSGLPIAFQLIYSEIISKHIQPENFFTYTAMRLRQIGKEIEEMKQKGI
jgi:hypothetical protein